MIRATNDTVVCFSARWFSWDVFFNLSSNSGRIMSIPFALSNTKTVLGLGVFNMVFNTVSNLGIKSLIFVPTNGL